MEHINKNLLQHQNIDLKMVSPIPFEMSLNHFTRSFHRLMTSIAGTPQISMIEIVTYGMRSILFPSPRVWDTYHVGSRENFLVSNMVNRSEDM